MSDEMISEIRQEISSSKKTRVAINGFGRIGRMILRAGFEDPGIDFAIINDVGGAKAAAYFLKYDSAHGTFPFEVRAESDYLIIGDKKIKVISERDINKLPWQEFNIDVVAECTGIFTDSDQTQIHIARGAKKVLISAPGKGDCFYLVRGVNDDEYEDRYKIVSNGSCTTNSISALMVELHKKFGIEKGMFSTVHSITGDQRILDASHSDYRRGRAAPFNIVPTSTGAAKSVVKLIPELEGKLNGIAYRVPTITGSVTDLNIEFKTNVSVEELNSYIKEIANGKLAGIVEYTEEEIVSSDIIGNSNSGIVDGKSTQVVAGNLAKLVVWYDNEWGFSNRMVEVIKLISR